MLKFHQFHSAKKYPKGYAYGSKTTFSPAGNSKNQIRICGKGVGLGLFPSDSLQSQSYEFIEISHIGPYYGVENDCRKFRSNRMDSFCENRKS